MGRCITLGRRACATLAAFTALLGGCAPLYSPHLSGRIVDAQSNQPVPGAELFTHLEVQGLGGGEPNVGSTPDRWTTTDAEGRFTFERKLIDPFFSYFITRVEPTPPLLVVDRRYGKIYLEVPDDKAQWSDLSFAVSPRRASFLYFESRREWPSLCSGWEEACTRMCDIAYGAKPVTPDETVEEHCEE